VRTTDATRAKQPGYAVSGGEEVAASLHRCTLSRESGVAVPGQGGGCGIYVYRCTPSKHPPYLDADAEDITDWFSLLPPLPFRCNRAPPLPPRPDDTCEVLSPREGEACPPRSMLPRSPMLRYQGPRSPTPPTHWGA